MSCSTPHRRILGATALAAALALLPAAASLADGATVIAAAGGAKAGGAPLACGGSVGANQSIDTSASGWASLSVGGSYVQVANGTSVSVGPDGGLELHSGAVRAVGLGQGGSAVAVHTPQATAQSAGGDLQVQVVGNESWICAMKGVVEIRPETSPQPVTRLNPDHCAAVDAGGQLRTVAAAPKGLALAGGASCVDVAVGDQFSPTDVAAPPPSFDPFPFDPDKRTYSPCDSPGTGCGVTNVTPPPTPPPPPTPGFNTGPVEDQPRLERDI